MQEIAHPGSEISCTDDLPVGLRGTGPRREAAVGTLRVLLAGAVRFELDRRAAALRRVPDDEIDDLATEAADAACIAVLRNLHRFRRQSRFTTWASKFALHEAAVRVRPEASTITRP